MTTIMEEATASEEFTVTEASIINKSVDTESVRCL